MEAKLTRASRVGDVDDLARPAQWEFMRMSRHLEAGNLRCLKVVNVSFALVSV